jgi:glycosyltransferase involved in cell wall biosynthesis
VISALRRPVKVWLVCTGVGILDRGIETFARECFDGLRERPELDLTLFKGAGKEAPGERVLWNLPRTGRAANLLGKAVRRNGYVVEQLSSFLPLVRAIRAERPEVIFSSESNLRFQLYRWRRWIGVPFKLLFSNGGPVRPPFIRTDFVQQVAPPYLEEALAAGEPKDKHFLVPYGIKVPSGNPDAEPGTKQSARMRLRLPVHRSLVLSVGWISAVHKRMDYLVREVAALPAPRPFLVMLGHMDEASPPILALANQLLGKDGYAARSVPYAEVPDYYRAADVFTLGSLKEGFGRVYLEALIGGLPCAVHDHDHPVMRFVLGGEGEFGDFSQPGALSRLLMSLLAAPTDSTAAARRRQAVRTRFGWDALAPAYLEMFRACLGR